MSQSFGILVSQMAMESQELLYAVLALSACSLASVMTSKSRFQTEAEKYIALSESYLNTELVTNGPHKLLAAILRTIRQFLSRISDAWMNKFDVKIESLMDLSTKTQGSSLIASAYGCLLRMGERYQR